MVKHADDIIVNQMTYKQYDLISLVCSIFSHVPAKSEMSSQSKIISIKRKTTLNFLIS